MSGLTGQNLELGDQVLRLDKAVKLSILRRAMLFQGSISSKWVVFHGKKQLKVSRGRRGTPHLQDLSTSAFCKLSSVVFLLFGKFFFSLCEQPTKGEDVEFIISSFQMAANSRYCDNRNNNLGKAYLHNRSV